MIDLNNIIAFGLHHRNQAKWKLRWLKLALHMWWKISSQLGKLVLQYFPRESMELDSTRTLLTPYPLGLQKMTLLILSPNLRKQASLEHWTTTETLTCNLLILCATFVVFHKYMLTILFGKMFEQHDNNLCSINISVWRRARCSIRVDIWHRHMLYSITSIF